MEIAVFIAVLEQLPVNQFKRKRIVNKSKEVKNQIFIEN